MTTWWRLCSLLLLSLSLKAAAAPVAPPFRIAGVVVDAVTGNPVRKCRLEAASTSTSTGRVREPGMRQSASGAAYTDDSGHFDMTLPSSGSWRLTASASGYVNQAYEAHGVYSSSVVLSATAPSFDLTFRLAPQSRVSGTILDEAGEGVRNATVELVSQPLSAPGEQGLMSDAPFLGGARRITQTDDRGSYEFAELMPGSYRLRVQARPWYSQGMRRAQQPGATSSQDPDLDVIYPPVWYPGVADQDQAELINLRPGDQQQADFQLAPSPALHLQVILPRDEQSGARQMPMFPVVEKIDAGDSGQRFGTGGTNLLGASSQGQIDIGGLAPGTYRVSLPGRDHNSAIVQVSEGSSHSVDLRQAQAGISQITIKFDGDDESFMGVELIDAKTNQHYRAQGGGPMPYMRGPSGRQSSNETITIMVPPGRYEVVARGREQFLTGISAQGADVSGRFITVRDGDVTLTLHTASGRATIEGIVALSNKPCQGAVVMIVPAGLDDPGSFTTVVRDQSNTDGSFNLRNVVPGEYILIAVDRGWDINWSDPSTLRRYLTQGVPLEVRRDAAIKQNIEAQSP